MKTFGSNLDFLQVVVDQSWDEVFIVNLELGSVVYFNQAAQQNLRLNNGKDVVALDVLLGKEQAEEILDNFRDSQLTQSDTLEYTLRMKRSDNSSYPARLKCQKYSQNGIELLLVNCVDITEKQKTERQLSYLANYDPLTGLPNRASLFASLEQAMSNANRNNKLVGLLYLNLDGFKGINERFGHEVGDNLVREAGKRLARSIRITDTVSRLSGDEFAIVLSNVNTIEDLEIVVQKIINKLNAPFILAGQEIVTSACVGVAVYPFNEIDDYYELLRQADAAMHRAKDSGRRNYVFYSSDISLAELRKNKMESALQMALKRQEFEVFYQPRVDLRDGRITGAEALLRWTNPDLGFVSPVEFIPVLEDAGLINDVGQWVLETGCMQLNTWREKGFNIRLSVNVSAHQFASGDFLQVLQNAISTSHVSPESLEMEITEGVLLHNHEQASEVLSSIRELGVKISLDDFGTGYSSLSYLKKFPIDILKIDRSFVMDLSHNRDSSVIVESIIGLAKNMSLQVTAEGIEELDHVHFLTDKNCDEGQGYFYGKPMPSFEFEQVLIEQEESLKRASGPTH
ncbi:MAG: EAL domain-containing protein [Gammaproteobacteria bacterium]|nr:EAL domain-containing protein [Gammaproteobacteria bacterium]